MVCTRENMCSALTAMEFTSHIKYHNTTDLQIILKKVCPPPVRLKNGKTK